MRSCLSLVKKQRDETKTMILVAAGTTHAQYDKMAIQKEAEPGIAGFSFVSNSEQNKDSVCLGSCTLQNGSDLY